MAIDDSMNGIEIIYSMPPFEYHGKTKRGQYFHLYKINGADSTTYALDIEGKRILTACHYKDAIAKIKN